MRLTGDPAPGTMNSSGGSGNFLLVPIPEYPPLDCVPNKTVKIVVLGASNVGKTGMDVRGDYCSEGEEIVQQFAIFLHLNCWFQCWLLGFDNSVFIHSYIFIEKLVKIYLKTIIKTVATLDSRGRHFTLLRFIYLDSIF